MLRNLDAGHQQWYAADMREHAAEKSTPHGSLRRGFSLENMFDTIAKAVADWTGRPLAFVCALALVLIWAATGPLFAYSSGWQLFINSTTTVITFLMVFALQYAQNSDTAALHAKIDGLIAGCSTTSNALLDLEHRPRDEVEAAKQRIVEGSP
jgi:low affinity Fe/Cu permease